MACLANNVISEGCCGQGEYPSQSAANTNSGVEPFSSGNVESFCCPVLVRLQRSGPASWAAGASNIGTMWRIFLQSATLEVPCPGGLVYLKRFSRLVTLQIGHTAGGRPGTKPSWEGFGAVHCSFRRWPALCSLCLLRTGSAPRSLII